MSSKKQNSGSKRQGQDGGKGQFEKKTKKIVKQKNRRSNNQINSQRSNQRNQSQNSIGRVRNLTGAKLGRPPGLRNKLKISKNPASDAEQIIFKYLDSIGLKHGIVFLPEHREILQAQQQASKSQNKINWTDDHKWNKQTQQKKVHKDKQALRIIRYIAQMNTELSQQHLLKLFLNFSSKFAEQCTEQIYMILTQELKTIYQDKQDNQKSKQKASALFQKLVFFSGKFTKQKIKYWIQITQSTETIKKQFIQMYLKLKYELTKVMNHMGSLKLYLQEQIAFDKKLKAIITEAKNRNKG